MHKSIVVIVFCISLFAIVPVSSAHTVSGVEVPDQINVNGTSLILNGAGMREKFFFDIYVAALYLPKAVHTTEAVLASPGPRRVLMHFVYKEVGRDKLVEGWNEGFEDNLTKEQLAVLRKRIDAFNALFDTVKRGDVVLLDYAPDSGTTVSINNHQRGTIPGKDFNDALLRIWLGDEPVTQSLKHELLGQ